MKVEELNVNVNLVTAVVTCVSINNLISLLTQHFY